MRNTRPKLILLIVATALMSVFVWVYPAASFRQDTININLDPQERHSDNIPPYGWGCAASCLQANVAWVTGHRYPQDEFWGFMRDRNCTEWGGNDPILPLPFLLPTHLQLSPIPTLFCADRGLDNGYHFMLATVDLGFTTADHGFNRGEIYTADGVHPILPLSGFDKGYLLINGVWRLWDDRYLTGIARDAPYQVDMIEDYHRFIIHSPIVFIPFALKDAQ